ncbi:DUF7263 family protein [Haloparvum sp. PAK95]|uniref:DUF7263 family protein n=1 Tax=Haloparvum sp. PAK95 TaxID=3418962 RepID=UPI003D2EB50B
MSPRRAGSPRTRAQANLLVVAVALVVLTAVTGTAVAMAEGALVTAERDSAERATTVAVAERLVAADSPVTRRTNVLDREAAMSLTAGDLERLVPELAGRAVRVRIGGVAVVDRGDPTGGTTIRRLGLLATTDTWAGTVPAGGESLTVPRRTDRITVTPSGDVETVRVDGRVVLHDPDGLDRKATVNVSRYDTLAVTAAGEGNVTVEATPETTEKALIVVTVDD